jgi:hypothetical protein
MSLPVLVDNWLFGIEIRFQQYALNHPQQARRRLAITLLCIYAIQGVAVLANVGLIIGWVLYAKGWVSQAPLPSWDDPVAIAFVCLALILCMSVWAFKPVTWALGFVHGVLNVRKHNSIP